VSIPALYLAGQPSAFRRASRGIGSQVASLPDGKAKAGLTKRLAAISAQIDRADAALKVKRKATTK
jgi:hypothetical protein